MPRRWSPRSGPGPGSRRYSGGLLHGRGRGGHSAGTLSRARGPVADAKRAPHAKRSSHGYPVACTDGDVGGPDLPGELAHLYQGTP